MTARVRWIDPGLAERLQRTETDAFRIAEGRDFFVERFARALLISHSGPCPNPELFLKNPAATGIESVFAKRLVHGPRGDDHPRHIHGSGPASFLVRENGLKYEVDLLGGYSCGLFLDQRENRLRLRELRPARVLNLFAYTCSFSVAAASVGALSVSVDLSKSSLHRGKCNFSHNGFPTDGHRFLAGDVFDVLPRLARRREVFDAIILDPPTFSRGRRGRVFRAVEHLREVLELALPCLAMNGHLLLSTNCSSISPAILTRIAGDLPCTPAPLPADIPSGASAIWVQNGG
jgi:23S rRNA (cytosine1962-C5)-methyltransferase